MTLERYLSEHGISRSAFARLIGVSPASVTRYVKAGEGGRSPRDAIMRRIREATGGAVTADDFLDQREAA